MAAVAVQDGGLVWQQVKKSLANANPAAQAAFKALREYLVSQKGNPQLQLLVFAAGSIDDGADGAVLATTTTHKIYGVYAKRVSDVDTTAAFLNVADDATDNSTAADAIVILRTNAANEEAFTVIPNGEALTAGIVVSATTAPAGTTESAATESSNGFVLVGA